MEKIIRSEDDPALIADKILSSYSFDVIILVLAANVLIRKDTTKVNERIQKWAERYENKIGFLAKSFELRINGALLEELINLLLRRFPN